MDNLRPSLSRLPSDISISPTAVFHVLGFTPAEGEAGTPISVRIHFHPGYSDALSVRLIVGHKAVHTTVREIKDATSYGSWQLDAIAPPFDSLQSTSTKVLLSVQALNEDHAILDTLTFGEFIYWSLGSSPREDTGPSPASGIESVKKPKLHVNTSPRVTEGHSFRRRGGSTYLPTPSPTSPPFGKPEVSLHRRSKADHLMRPGKGGKQNNSNLHAQTPILDLVSPLQNICVGWSTAEVNAGRRLVRFSKVQDGRRLTVSFEAIKPEDYRESDSVISCIYREESDSCFVTSVDIIFLLERLTNSDFPVEEKNRIRRNLEGLRPTTVSKHKPGFEEFFQRIMEFPDPKPRNIEKDLKVFEWALLDQALDKILSKYTIDTSNLPDHPESSVEHSPSSGSDEYQASPFPIKTPEQTFVDPAPVKFEALNTDEYRFFSADGSEAYCSPVDVPSAAPYVPPLYHGASLGNTNPSGSSSGSWTSATEYKPNEQIGVSGLDHFGTYTQAVGPGGVINYVDLDFSSYDNLAFSSIPGDGIADNPYI